MDLLRRPALLHARATREFFTEAERVPPASFPVRLVSLAHPLQRCRPLHRSARDLIRRVTERGGTGYERRISDGLRLIARLPRLPRGYEFPDGYSATSARIAAILLLCILQFSNREGGERGELDDGSVDERGKSWCVG